MADLNLKEIARRMEGAFENLHKEFSGLRTGRASTSLLDTITVDAYGANMPLNQCASVSVPEPRMLSVQVWDAGLAKSVEKAIANAGLGLNPQPDGNLIRVPLPDLTEERRVELTRVAAKYAENARIAVRNIRRDGMDQVKKLKSDNDISEDDQRAYEGDIQVETDAWIKKIDADLVKKEAEIKQV